MDDTKDRKLYIDKEVYNMLGISESTWHRLKRAGKGPKATKFPGTVDYYTIENIDAWVKDSQ
jgi:predicted DNA-binding transcriptional regulator AlpA